MSAPADLPQEAVALHALEALPHAACVLDAGREVLLSNAAWRALERDLSGPASAHGAVRDGLGWRQPPDLLDEPGLRAEVARVLAGGAPSFTQEVVRRSAFRLRCVVVRGARLEGAGARMVLLTAEPAVGHRAAELELLRSEARFHRAQELAGVGSWELSLEDRVVSGSAQAFRVYGLPYDPGGLALDRLQAMVHPDDRPQAARALAELVERGVPYDVEFRHRRPDGTERWLHSVARLLAADGAPPIVVGAVQDVTALRQLVDEAREGGAVGVAADVAHGVNSPLAAVQADVRFALEELAALLGPAAERLTQAEVLRAADVVDALRDALQAGARIQALVQELRCVRGLPAPEAPGGR